MMTIEGELHKSNWIKVEDVLPPEDDDFLGCDSSGFPQIMKWSYRDEDGLPVFVDSNRWEPLDCLYWMPLPEPPEALNQGN